MARLDHGSGRLLGFKNGTVFIISVGFGGMGFGDQYVNSPNKIIKKKNVHTFLKIELWSSK